MLQTNPVILQSCDMQDDILEKVVEIIKADPHGGSSLNLYALVSTLKMENSGYMYMCVNCATCLSSTASLPMD
jgi:hypothetical protein